MELSDLKQVIIRVFAKLELLDAALPLARLKSELLRETDGAFSEAKFGCKKFKDVLLLIPDTVKVEIVGTISHATLIEAGESLGEVPAQDIEEQVFGLISAENTLAAGELLLSELLPSATKTDSEQLMVRALLLWLGSRQDVIISTVAEVVDRRNEFVERDLCLALVHVAARVNAAEAWAVFDKLFYRLESSLKQLFDIPKSVPLSGLAGRCVAELESVRSELMGEVAVFCRCNPYNAKQASISVVKSIHRYRPFALQRERALLSEADVLLGPVFRKFCESCERHDAETIPRRTEEIARQLDNPSPHASQTLIGNLVLAPIRDAISNMLDDALADIEREVRPILEVPGDAVKLPLDTFGAVSFPLRLRNSGRGTARQIALAESTNLGLVLRDPGEPFDLNPKSERLITLEFDHEGDAEELECAFDFVCTAKNGESYSFPAAVQLVQQAAQPDWDEVRRRAPYSVNPVRMRQQLFGRDAILSELELNAFSQISTFIWGHKRVGKTSLLQVLASQVRSLPDQHCIFLRMGELSSMHEGQIAHLLAERIAPEGANIPSEAEFGSGLGRLVRFVDEISSSLRVNTLVVIDEFDDLDPAFYSGERGKQFVKALRSLSELGITFFFAGSERMDAIFHEHSVDLNKWLSKRLDHLASNEDCAELIQEPVRGAVEYSDGAVSKIIDWCQGNPFFLNVVCFHLFQKCWGEKRTFVDENYAESSLIQSIVTLGPSNFAHFWEDNPTLNVLDKKTQSAQNAIYLGLLAKNGGSAETIDDLLEAQSAIDSPPSFLATRDDLRQAEGRLLRRRVLERKSERIVIALPIFEFWLKRNVEAVLLPIWFRFQEEISKQQEQTIDNSVVVEAAPFAIPEDDLLRVSENLIFHGKQKDVAEIRKWLRQFDDDNRIEIAFMLLERMSKLGFMDHGAYTIALDSMDKAITAHRQSVGQKAWNIVRRRKDNFCLAYVDGTETKSGATVARDLHKRMSAGKIGKIQDVVTWYEQHLDADPMVAIVDDFCGTGDTIRKGLEKLTQNSPLREALKQRRLICVIQYAYDEAITLISETFPELVLIPIHTLGEELKAFSEGAEIFEADEERKFARDVMLQIGRQLVPQMPLGFGDFAGLVAGYNSIPNNTLPVFWSNGVVNGKDWIPLFPRA